MPSTAALAEKLPLSLSHSNATLATALDSPNANQGSLSPNTLTIAFAALSFMSLAGRRLGSTLAALQIINLLSVLRAA